METSGSDTILTEELAPIASLHSVALLASSLKNLASLKLRKIRMASPECEFVYMERIILLRIILLYELVKIRCKYHFMPSSPFVKGTDISRRYQRRYDRN